MKARFDRQEYLAFEEVFEAGQLDDVTKELCEFSDDIEDMAYELAYTRYALAKVEARHNALKEAAKGLLAIHKRHKGLTVYSEQDYRDIWSERVDALAALVGEE